MRSLENRKYRKNFIEVAEKERLEALLEDDPYYFYNTLPFGLLKESRQVKNLGIDSVRLSFTMESPDEAVHILKDFTAAYRDGQDVPDRKFTKGHFKRGAQ